MNIPDAKAAVDNEWEKVKLPAWQMAKGKIKREVIQEAPKERRTVHFATLMDICHLKNADKEQTFQKCKGRVVLPNDNVENDSSGSCVVFTEKGSSAPPMTVAKVMEVIARLPGCAGQAADAISAYTQVKMKDAPQILKIPKSECPDIWMCLPRHEWPKSWSNIEDTVVPLARNMWSTIWRIIVGNENF